MRKYFVSKFDNYSGSIPSSSIDISDWLLSSEFKGIVECIRNCKDVSECKRLKASLPCITPSGLFLKRGSRYLIKHSKLICIDIDGKENPDIKDWELLKDSIADFPGLYYAGFSVSGKGLFLIIKITKPDNHLLHFYAIERDFIQRNIFIDTVCKDVARLRGASYDGSPVFNPEVIPYNNLLSCEKMRYLSDSETSSIVTKSRVEALIEQIVYSEIDMTRSYADWFAIGCSFASEFGEDGRVYFHQVSQFYGGYDYLECNKQYDKCLDCCSKTSINTFFYYCKQYDLMAKKLYL